MPTAVLVFDFDPLLHLGDGAVRWETVAIAAGLFAALVIAGVAARGAGLRPDDMLFVVLGIVPGAVVGGRLGYVLLHPAFFLADGARIVDPGTGSLELTLGVVGGALTGSLVAVLLDGRPGPWLHVAAVPTLIALATGKLAAVLGGTGQGQATTADPATAYLGTGPWGSLGPAIPSIPAQAIEAIAAAVVLAIIVGMSAAAPLRRRDGRVFLVAIALWAIARAAVATTWRDPLVVGPLRAEQVIDIAVAAGALIGAAILVRRARGWSDTPARGSLSDGSALDRAVGPEPGGVDPAS